MFKHYPEQRQGIMDDLVRDLLQHLNPGKAMHKYFIVQVGCVHACAVLCVQVGHMCHVCKWWVGERLLI